MYRNKTLRWNVGISGDMEDGEMGGNLTSDPLNVDGKPFSIQLAWPATNSPVGTLSFEVSNNGGANWDPVDPSLFSPPIVHPAGTASSQTIIFRDFSVAQVRAKYTRTSGGSGAALAGRCVSYP